MWPQNTRLQESGTLSEMWSKPSHHPRCQCTISHSLSSGMVTAVSCHSFHDCSSTGPAYPPNDTVVMLEAPAGQQMQARVLLDSVASISLTTKRVVQQLQLNKRLDISGAQGVTSSSSHSAMVSVISPGSEHSHLSLTAFVVPRVTCDLPMQGSPLHGVASYHMRGLKLAFPTSTTNPGVLTC